MPKRWRVLYSGKVYDRFASTDSAELQQAGFLGEDYSEVEADELEVSGGALVFLTGGTADRVFAAGSYWFCVRIDEK
ncbi:hypothetical protein [Nocardioides mesophilus]|uniref:Uncharacterized protein n=1 Tax=Nocardioides mesophilus TaxID=433659 RepID=A0A7G9RFU7_9ACTN|nr:hypothetical protein [Nocardioides mesophilus]QNN54472.1 hypothetical protein H9L09_09265 [Nocardioides mesophilus]